VKAEQLKYANFKLMKCYRAQSERFGTRIFSETVEKLDLSKRPFRIYTDEKEVEALSVIIATGEASFDCTSLQ
jgi:thioredoxin reductase (NADPH)